MIKFSDIVGKKAVIRINSDEQADIIQKKLIDPAFIKDTVRFPACIRIRQLSWWSTSPEAVFVQEGYTVHDFSEIEF